MSREGVWGRSTRTALIAAIVTQVATSPGQTVGISVFVDHLIADLDLTRSSVATAYLIGTGCGAVSMPTAGRLIDQRGLRWATTFFGASFAVVLVAMSGITGFATLAIGFALTRMLGQGALTLTATTSVALRFDRNRGAALGILSAVGGGLMSLVPLGVASLIGWFGWRTTWMILGAILACVTLGLRRVVRDHDEGDDWNDHDSAPARSSRITPGARPATAERRTVSDALRSPAFWAVIGAVTLAAAFGTALVFHQITLLTSRGLTEVQAAANFIPQTAATAAASIGVGRLADRFPPRWMLAAATFSLGLAGMSVLAVNSTLTAALYGATLGGSGASIRTIEGAVLPRWFGTAQLGELRGIVLAAGVAGSAVGPVLLSIMNDASGSYTTGVLAFSAASALVAIAILAFVPRAGPTPTTVQGSRVG